MTDTQHDQSCPCCGEAVDEEDAFSVLPGWCASDADLVSTQKQMEPKFGDDAKNLEWYTAEGEQALANLAHNFGRSTNPDVATIRENLETRGGLLVLALLRSPVGGGQPPR